MVAGQSNAFVYYLNGGPGIETDPMKGFERFRKASDKGDQMAVAMATVMATVAVLSDNGFGQFFEGLEAKEMAMGALEQGEVGSAASSGPAIGADTLKHGTMRAVRSELSEKQYCTGAVDGTFNPVFIRALASYARSVKSQPKDG